MLTFEDEATIRNTIMKRLHEDGKTEIADLKILNYPSESPPHIKVGIWFVLKDRIQREGLIDPRSFFDLPAEFSRSQLLNEIDEIAEQLKVIRQETAIIGLVFDPNKPQPRKVVMGTGLRGRWGDDGKGAGDRDMTPQLVQ